MANIIPKLNLNKTPNLVENNSLVFAKNIRLDVDGTIHRDYGISSITKTSDKTYNNIIERLKDDIDGIEEYDNIKRIINSYKNFKIVGVIPYNNEFYLFLHLTDRFLVDEGQQPETGIKKVVVGPGINIPNVPLLKPTFDVIVKYDEKTNKFTPCFTGWTYSNGDIDGKLIVNLRGEKLLIVCESNADKLVPMKSINLSLSTLDDDESIYTQSPNIPITNLNVVGYYNDVIPNGVYQFFVRYEIRKNLYTKWFPASKDCFVANTNKEPTSFGTVKYVDIHKDSDYSLIFSVKHLLNDYKKLYKSFQIGFILSHDDATYARAWKHFPLDTSSIYFNYRANDAEEVEIADMLASNYSIYNVGNVTAFKNNIYISNYIETDFNNAELQNYADDVRIELGNSKAILVYGDYPLLFEDKSNPDSDIVGLVVNNVNKHFTKANTSQFNTNPSLFNDIATNVIYKNDLGDDDKVIKRLAYFLYIKDKGVKAYQQLIQTSIEYTDYDLTIKLTTSFNNQGFDDNVKFDKGKDTYRWGIKNGGLKSIGIYLSDDSEVYDTLFIDEEDANFYTNIATDIINYIDKTIEERLDQNTKTFTNPHIRLEAEYDIIDEESSSGESIGTYTHTINIYFELKDEKLLQTGTNAVDINTTTLLPFQKYKFYIHYVKSNGEVTNGFYCSEANGIDGIIEVGYQGYPVQYLYPKFSNIKTPNGYVACFFSIVHVENKITSVIDFREEYWGDEKYNATTIVGVSFDLNAYLLSVSNNVSIAFDDDTDHNLPIEYHNSNDPDYRYFGNAGLVSFNITDSTNDIHKTTLLENAAYIIIPYNLEEVTDTTELIKCTPYIKLSTSSESSVTYDNFKTLNLLGYICKVYPIHRHRANRFYTDGSTAFVFTRTDAFAMAELGRGGTQYSALNIINTDKNKVANTNDHLDMTTTENQNTDFLQYNIYSNFNLNCLALSEEPKRGNKVDVTTQDVYESNTFTSLFSSLLLNAVYELPSMYKDYIRKSFYKYNENTMTVFDNTIRQSTTLEDEDNATTITFEANDYYNVPTNRGKIVKLISAGDYIGVHTEDSMFVFSGSNTLTAANGQVQQEESNVFDTGIKEVFSVEYGYAGLSNKDEAVDTDLGYFFFDKDAKIVHLFDGKSNTIKLSDTIEKLFRRCDIDTCNFASDRYNNRIMLCVHFTDGKTATLSFSTLANKAAFISLHDFKFTKTFNTKTKCYYITDNKDDILTVDKDIYACYTKLNLESDNLYPYSISKIIDGYNCYDSIIDVIENDKFENIKTLNAINWCGNIVNNEFVEITTDDVSTQKVADDTVVKFPCKGMFIYTDSCATPIEMFDNLSTGEGVSLANSYKYPRWNQGIWTYNYFRNIEIINNNPYISDENSLIEGKYFVTRFYFDTEFKLETLKLNYNIKL